MKNLSLRKFRIQIADLTDPVEVSLRDTDGNIRVLGYWTPYLQYPADAVPIHLHHDIVPPKPLEIPVEADPSTFRVIGSPEQAAALVPVNPVRAVPKPGKRSNR